MATHISSDPAIPDEQKISLLSEIGGQLGIPTVGQLANLHARGMPADRAVTAISGAIRRAGEQKARMAQMEQENAQRYKEGMQRHQAIWGPRLTEAWGKVQAAEQRAKEADLRYQQTYGSEEKG